jgi:hypothetical protein
MRFFRHAFAAVATLLAVAVHAQTGPIRPNGATVIVNEVPVVEFKTTYNGLSPEARANLFVERLTNSTGSVTVTGSGEDRKIMRGASLLTVLTPDEASANGTSVEGLATNLFQSLKSALSLPALKLPQTSMRIPQGENRTVKLTGSKAFAATITSSDYKVAKAQKGPDGLLIQTSGQGQATLTITAGDATQNLNVEVWPYAAPFPQNITASITGYPASEDTMRGAIEGALRTQVKAVPGANLVFNVGAVSTLEIGSSQVIDVPVHVNGPRSIANEGVVKVTVKNLPIAKRSEGELWYCNDPESLKKTGPLFSSPLLRDSPVRLLYHHVNDTLYPLCVRVQVVNDSDTPARLLLMPGDSKPDKNPVLAGLMAADQYIRHWMSNSGEVVTVGARCSMPISLRKLTPGDTMSGLCALRLLDGPDSVLVRADAIPPFEADPRWMAALNSPAPWRFVGSPKISYYDQGPTVTSTHIYPNPFKQEDVEYQVGGRYGFVRIGQKPIANTSQDKALEGNFGVVYTIRANMINSTNAPADVEVVFEASAGYAAALFVVNGQLKKTQPLPPKGETQLAVVHLDPGASKWMTLMTIPHSGGSYPATVTIRPIQDATRYKAVVVDRK